MPFFQLVVPGKNRRLTRFSDDTAIAVAENDYVGWMCCVKAAKGNELLRIISSPKPGFYQAEDGRVFPKNRIVGAAYVVITETDERVKK